MLLLGSNPCGLPKVRGFLAMGICIYLIAKQIIMHLEWGTFRVKNLWKCLLFPGNRSVCHPSSTGGWRSLSSRASTDYSLGKVQGSSHPSFPVSQMIQILVSCCCWFAAWAWLTFTAFSSWPGCRSHCTRHCTSSMISHLESRWLPGVFCREVAKLKWFVLWHMKATIVFSYWWYWIYFMITFLRIFFPSRYCYPITCRHRPATVTEHRPRTNYYIFDKHPEAHFPSINVCYPFSSKIDTLYNLSKNL